MQLFLIGMHVQQVSELLSVQLHVCHLHNGLHTLTGPLLLQKQEHILGHAVNKAPLLILERLWKEGDTNMYEYTMTKSIAMR